MDAFWLQEAAPPKLRSNTARKGDADYHSPLPTPGHGLPKIKKPKKPRAPRTAAQARGAAPAGPHHVDFGSASSVKAFQARHGLKADGVVGPKTQAKVQALRQDAHERSASASSSSSGATGRKTKHASSGPQGGQFISGGGAEEAAAVQRALSPSDKAGMDASIKAFQKKHGLQVDGKVGRQTALALSGKYREARSTAPGAMGARERTLLRARHQPSARRARVKARRARGGAVIEDDGERLREDSPLWDPTLHPKDALGKFAQKLLPGKPGKHAHLIPEYDPTPLKFGKTAGGTTGARKAHHRDGSTWLVKTYGGNEDRVATELLANAVYRHMGARAARAGRIRLKNGKQALAYPFLEGKPRMHVFQQRGRDTRSAELGQHFMTDALLGNWDVAGLDDDNVLWDPQGQPFRVDQGGTLEFRAQGQKKFFGPTPTEVTSMLIPGKGQAARSMAVTVPGLRAQAAALEKQLTPGVIDGLVDAAGFRDAKMRERVRTHLKARAKWMGRFARGEVGMPSLQEAEDAGSFWLAEMAGAPVNWKEHEHPRGEHGKFIKGIFGLGTASGSKALQLDSKTYVKRDKDGTYRVVRSGQIIKGFHTAEDAARAALDRSAKGKDADSVGGETSYANFNEYLKARLGGDVGVTKADHATTFDFGGKQLNKDSGAEELVKLRARLAQTREAGKEDKYVARAVPTLEAREKELARKVKDVGGNYSAGSGTGPQGLPSKPVAPPIEGKLPGPSEGTVPKKAGHHPNAPMVLPSEMKDAPVGESWSKVLGSGPVTIAKKPDSWVVVINGTGKDYAQATSAAMAYNAGKHSAAGSASPGSGKAPEPPQASGASGKELHGLKVSSTFTNSVGTTFVVEKVDDVHVWVRGAGTSPGSGVPIPHEDAAKQIDSGNWKVASTAPSSVAGAPAATPAALIPGSSAGIKVGDSFGVATAAGIPPKPDTYTVGAKDGSYYPVKNSAGQVIGHYAPSEMDEMVTSGQWKPKGLAAPSAPKPKKFGKNEKQKNTLGNQYDPNGAAPINDLDLEPGDKIQFEEGKWVYEYVGPATYGSGIKVKGPNGKIKQWQGYSKPKLVIKANQQALAKKDPNAGPASAPIPGSSTPATPAPAPTAAAPAYSVASIKQNMPPAPSKTIGGLDDGDVIKTPDGKVGVMKTSEPAYTGYSSAYDIETGQKFEAPSTKPPVGFAPKDSPIGKAAAEHLKKAQAGTQVSTAGGVAGSAAKPKQSTAAQPTIGPPAQFSGVPAWHDANQHLPHAPGTSHYGGPAPKGPAVSLTSDETDAVKKYTASGYVEINAQLRDSNHVGSPVLAKRAKALDKAIAKGVVQQDVWIGRKTQNQRWKQEAAAGKIVHDNGFLSTSIDPNTWSGEIKLNILVRKGANALYVDPISSSSGEAEVILPRGSMFHVLKREETGGSTVLYVEML